MCNELPNTKIFCHVYDTDDLREKNKSIRELTICVEESQSQCNECFAEAIEQDKLLELHRDGIKDLQNEICRIQNDACATVSLLNAIYYSVLSTVKEQLAARVNDFRMLKYQVDTLVQSRNALENKYHTAKRSWKEAEEKLQEFKEATLKNEGATKICESIACQSKIEVEDKDCSTQDAEFNIKDTQHELQSEINILAKENEDLKRQLQKWKLDFDIIDKELKIEKENDSYAQGIADKLQKMRDTACCLRFENEQLKQMEVNDLYDQIGYNEVIIREQTEAIEEFQKKLNTAENMISIQRGRIQSLKSLLKEKSDKMVNLQADYEVVKNDNSILRNENIVLENRAREDICLLKKKLKQVQLQLCFTEDNYHRVTQDFNRTQANLSVAVKREADLQEILTNTEKDYCTKLINAERENVRLEDLLHKLGEELENVQQKYSSKNAEYMILHDTYKSYVDEVESMQLQIEKEREKLVKEEESNRCLMQQLKECIEQNCSLMREKAAIEQNNSQNITELRELLELKKEYQLKNKSLACISAELTQTVISRSELCNESQYVVSCIRAWMEEQRKNVENLATKLKFKQQQLLQLGFEKKAFLATIKELRRVNYLLTQRLKKTYKPGRCIRNLCTGPYMSSIAQQNLGVRLPHTSNRLRLLKKCTGGLINATRRISVCGNPCWFPKMEYLTNELRKNNLWCNENVRKEENIETALEESRDCGYQSSTSK